MIEYKFIYFEEQDTIYNGKNDGFIRESLKDLVNRCKFIVTNYDIMYPKKCIKRVGNSLRGPTIEFTEGTMTYFYNIKGGYQ